jgi:hypothetical protein
MFALPRYSQPYDGLICPEVSITVPKVTPIKIPWNALTDGNGVAILDENGNYILIDL